MLRFLLSWLLAIMNYNYLEFYYHAVEESRFSVANVLEKTTNASTQERTRLK